VEVVKEDDAITMNKLWTRKNALEEVRKTLEEQKEDRWIKKMKELKEERRKRKDNDSPIRHNFTEKIKSEL
jgi:bisphosphoglycerate-independent phosphoglycerate mutase (AlkP superfamily)